MKIILLTCLTATLTLVDCNSWVINNDLTKEFVKPRSSNELHTYGLGVGQGDCAILQCPENDDLLIKDMGSKRSTDLKTDRIKDMLDTYVNDYPKARINIIITHGHADHYNYFDKVFTTSLLINKVDSVILGGKKPNYSTAFYNWLSSTFGSKVTFVNKEDSCYGNDDCTIDFLLYGSNPNYEFPQLCNRGVTSKVKFNALSVNLGGSTTADKNAKSVVLRVDFGTWSMLLVGDFEGPAQHDIVEHYKTTKMLDVDMYKIAHHGASTNANSKEFLEAIKPDEVFASQAYPAYGYHHPRCDVIDRLLLVTTLSTINPSLPYDFKCYDTVSKKVVVRSDLKSKSSHITCPNDNVSGEPDCYSLKIVSAGSKGDVYYIPVKPLTRQRSELADFFRKILSFKSNKN